MRGLKLPPPVCAVVDVGSNSLHLQVARLGPEGLETLAAERAGIRLGELVDGAMPEDRLRQVQATLAAWIAEARVLGAQAFEVSATAAVRDATNTDALRQRLRSLGLNLVLLSGRDEGLRTWQGARGALGWTQGLLVDMGGRSLEIVLEDAQGIQLAESVPIGHLVATALGSVSAIERHVATQLAHIRLGPLPPVVLTAGTALALTRMAAFARGETPEHRHGQTASLLELQALEEQLHRGEAQDNPGWDLRRGDTLPWGATALRASLQHLGIERWTTSQDALRSGLLQDLMSDPGRAPCP
jgi:exopolyphosphatase/guanosine-5'-triphosphate,3'-diphosphate pyrophosphatase